MKNIVLATAGILLSGQVAAWEAGHMLVRVGATSVSPDGGGSNLILGGTTDTGLDLSAGDNTQLGLNLAYFVSDRMAIELLAATPFKHDVNAEGTLVTDATVLPETVVAEITHLPPTLSLNYYFTGADSALQFYGGLGVNYTFTFDEEFNATGASLGLDNLSVSNSYGLSYQLGVDYALDDNWSLNASARYIDIELEASMTADGSAAPTVPAGTYTSDVEVNPYVYTLSVGYSF